MKAQPTLSMLALAAGALLLLSGPAPADNSGDHGHDATSEEPATASLEVGGADHAVGHKPVDVSLIMPVMSSERGMTLFIEKACVTCHSVNGVGGHDAAALDAHTMDPVMNFFDLAAKMWTMAPIMIEAQEEALGEQVLFTGEELADIVAFLHDDEMQHRLTDEMLPPRIAGLMDHQHGGASGPAAHSEEIGHGDSDDGQEQASGEEQIQVVTIKHEDDGHKHAAGEEHGPKAEASHEDEKEHGPKPAASHEDEKKHGHDDAAAHGHGEDEAAHAD